MLKAWKIHLAGRLLFRRVDQKYTSKYRCCLIVIFLKPWTLSNVREHRVSVHREKKIQTPNVVSNRLR